MNYSGDAAEQIVRLSLEGVEVAARITGTAAKEIALFLVAALKNNDKGKLKLKGKARLTSMLKSGKALEIISVRERDLSKFAKGAKEYGIVYCVLRNKNGSGDRLCDVMVKADDSPKISRLMERFEFAAVDRAKIESEIVADMAPREDEAHNSAHSELTPENSLLGAEPEGLPFDADPEAKDTDDIEKLLNELLGTGEGKAEPVAPAPEKTGQIITEPSKAKPVREAPIITEPMKAGNEQENSPPFAVGPEPVSINPSEPISESRKKPERTTSSKQSVKEEIRELKASRKQQEAELPKREERAPAGKLKSNATTMHKQPQRNKPKKTKGSR